MFHYTGGRLFCEGVDLEVIAKQAGTPCYVYSAQVILDAYHAYDSAFGDMPHMVCYAVKANSSLGVLALLARAGCGFDIVSGGELFRVLKAGGDPARVVFSGVGKTAAEIELALSSGICNFNCESEPELGVIDAVAGRLGLVARFALRVNPDVDAVTHPYISTGLRDHKFGIDINEAPAVYHRAKAFGHLRATGVDCHIGSQILDYSSILEAAGKVMGLVETLRADGLDIDHVDLGGGLGIAYEPDHIAPAIREFVAAVRSRIGKAGLTVMMEPGRSIVGQAGVLLTQVLYRKRTPSKEFVVVDAAMNDLIRPMLYGAHHAIVPLREDVDGSGAGKIVADVVGPICETGDFLARDREMTAVGPGDYLSVASAGAYGFVQASNYNSRPRGPEVLVEGNRWRVIRERETYEDLIKGETL
ncbi:MAG TPA: diaminopimelate decarboxylase [Bryobacteraceae bacterium]|jgi:diaminopimelate decarboxylase|nr:diaminopimelate decarboxylase [Bryobacteraceae bacterium]